MPKCNLVLCTLILGRNKDRKREEEKTFIYQTKKKMSGLVIQHKAIICHEILTTLIPFWNTKGGRRELIPGVP